MNTQAHCAQCDVYRRVTSIMGGSYYTLATCGHVVAIDRAVVR